MRKQIDEVRHPADASEAIGSLPALMQIAALFPGQGTQAPAMGMPWREHPAWRALDAAEAASGAPLTHLVLDADADELARTRAAQLAVLATSLVIWEAIRSVLPTPVAFAGHSLGQVTALVASGALEAEDGVRFAAARADATQHAADINPGKMIAVLGAELSTLEDVCEQTEDCWVANDNAPGQVVLAGTPDGVAAGAERAQAAGARRVMPLAVGGAFHTPLMASAVPALTDALAGVSMRDPAAPVVSNLDAEAYRDAESLRTQAPEHVTTRVRWRESVDTMATLGVEAFVEIGHGSMLAGLGKRIRRDLPVITIATPEDLGRLQEVA